MLYTTLRLQPRLVLLALVALAIALVPQPNARARPLDTPAGQLPTVISSQGPLQGAQAVGDRAVFLARSAINAPFDLYSVPLAGGLPTRLTAGLPPGNIKEYKVSAAGMVVFLMQRASDQRLYLYSAPAAGGVPTLLGPTYVPNRPNSQLVFSLAGERAVFAADVQCYNCFELFSVAVAGGAVARLSPNLPSVSVMYPVPYWVTLFAINDGNGQQVAFSLKRGPVPQGSGLYAVPTDGSAQPRLIGTQASKLDLTPGGQRVVYVTGNELRTARFDGSGETLIASGNNICFSITPDSARVVYTISDGQAVAIKSALLSGGASVTVAPSVRYADSSTFALSPNGASVFYNDPDMTALLHAPTLGGAAETVISATISPASLHFTGDSTHALFLSWVANNPGIYSYALASGDSARIDEPTLSTGGLLLLEHVTAGGRVVYTARTAAATDMRLYSVSAGGGATIPLTGDLGPGHELVVVHDVDDNGMVLFISGDGSLPPALRWTGLYAVPANGSAPARALFPLPKVYLPAVVR